MPKPRAAKHRSADLEKSQPRLLPHLIVRVDAFSLALAIESITAAYQAPHIVPLPLAQPGILGAVNVHGQVVPVSDFRRSLRIKPREAAMSDSLLVLRLAGSHQPIAAIVDEVQNIVELNLEELLPPETLFHDTPVNKRIIAGIICGEQLCAVIDVAGLTVPDVWDEETERAILGSAIQSSDAMAARTALLAQPMAAASSRGTDVSVFVLGEQHYAVPISSVVEFFQNASHAPILRQSPLDASLLNQRGEAVALYNIKSLFGLAPSPLTPLTDGLVIAGKGFKIAIAVDRLEGLETLSSGNSMSHARPGKYCASVHVSPRGPIQLIDVDALLAAPQLGVSNGA